MQETEDEVTDLIADNLEVGLSFVGETYEVISENEFLAAAQARLGPRSNLKVYGVVSGIQEDPSDEQNDLVSYELRRLHSDDEYSYPTLTVTRVDAQDEEERFRRIFTGTPMGVKLFLDPYDSMFGSEIFHQEVENFIFQLGNLIGDQESKIHAEKLNLSGVGIQSAVVLLEMSAQKGLGIAGLDTGVFAYRFNSRVRQAPTEGSDKSLQEFYRKAYHHFYHEDEELPKFEADVISEIYFFLIDDDGKTHYFRRTFGYSYFISLKDHKYERPEEWVA